MMMVGGIILWASLLSVPAVCVWNLAKSIVRWRSRRANDRAYYAALDRRSRGVR